MQPMFSLRYQQIISKVAMFLVLFAALAPSISHALAAQNNNSSFLQEICSSDGSKKIVIQAITTHGQQLATVLESKSPNQNKPVSAAHHFEHCPFCSAGAANLAIAPATAIWVFMLAEQARAINFEYVTPLQTTYHQTAHPSRAPPAFV